MKRMSRRIIKHPKKSMGWRKQKYQEGNGPINNNQSTRDSLKRKKCHSIQDLDSKPCGSWSCCRWWAQNWIQMACSRTASHRRPRPATTSRTRHHRRPHPPVSRVWQSAPQVRCTLEYPLASASKPAVMKTQAYLWFSFGYINFLLLCTCFFLGYSPITEGNWLTLSLLSSKSVFSQPFKKRLYEWCSENL